MSLTLMLALQAAAPAQPAQAPAPSPLAPIDFDLARLARDGTGTAGRGCRAGDPVPITVCARRSSVGDYPMAEWARLFTPGPLRAEAGLGGGAVLRAYGEQVEIAPGLVSNRLMIGVRLPF